jgi:hypothetical protein
MPNTELDTARSVNGKTKLMSYKKMKLLIGGKVFRVVFRCNY